MSELETLVTNRRSAMNFVEGVDIPESEFEAMFSLNKFAPSAFNLQHTHYVVVTDPEIKDKVYLAANKQHKVKTASAAILVLGDPKAYRQVGALNEGMLALGVMSKLDYDLEVENVTAFYESRGERFQRDEAIRSASLSAMQLMLIAKDRGWDTCPMIGFDPQAMSEALDVPEPFVPVMLITIGKSDTAKIRPRGYRKPVGQQVNYNRFGGSSSH
ncbi:nitroreductase family protein [Cohnella faecalis]|uniref:Nitroreductase family protein n=1 Tax=Cohnella faecalis TaxID=2315694 RepID=A0A398CIG0_9BACL|nr:nitroreductase family protein [Cohnella faecalis]RIE01842.1 nitroreductase family protein [Cohnella faecalis]